MEGWVETRLDRAGMRIAARRCDSDSGDSFSWQAIFDKIEARNRTAQISISGARRSLGRAISDSGDADQTQGLVRFGGIAHVVARPLATS